MGFVPVVVEFLHILVKLGHQALHLWHIGVEPRRHLLGFQAAIRETRSQDRVRVELAERGLEEGHREGGGHGGEARADAGAVGVDLHPEELLGPRKAETGAQRVEALDDLVAGDLDLVDEEVAAKVVG